MVSYKEIQSLAGYTSLVDEIKVVLKDLNSGKFSAEGPGSNFFCIQEDMIESR